MQRLMAHCGLIDADAVLPPPAIGDEVLSQGKTVRRMFHENIGHGAGLMSSHNQFPCDGFWRPQKQLWDTIEEGESLGAVVDLFGAAKAASCTVVCCDNCACIGNFSNRTKSILIVHQPNSECC
jgi:hypothetical protein